MANEIEKLLTQFNIDPQNRKIRDYYEEDNLWRTLKIERDENSHSAFIAWLLGTETTRENSPILNFLNLIVRCKNDNVVVDQGYNNLKTAILSFSPHSFLRKSFVSTQPPLKRIDSHIILGIQFQRYGLALDKGP